MEVLALLVGCKFWCPPKLLRNWRFVGVSWGLLGISGDSWEIMGIPGDSSKKGPSGNTGPCAQVLSRIRVSWKSSYLSFCSSAHKERRIFSVFNTRPMQCCSSSQSPWKDANLKWQRADCSWTLATKLLIFCKHSQFGCTSWRKLWPNGLLNPLSPPFLWSRTVTSHRYLAKLHFQGENAFET